MTSGEIDRRQRERQAGHPNLKEGHQRETNTMHHLGAGWAPADETDGTVEVNVLGQEKPAKRFYGPGNTEEPRRVAEDVYGQMWKWAQSSPEAYALTAQIMRHNNPSAFSHLTEDELAAQMEQHAKDAARKATETVYKNNKWDRGNVIGAARHG